MILGPVFMVAVFRGLYKEAFIIILIATLTDFLDGHIARIWKMQTRIGKMLDPLADKVVILCGVIALLIKFNFPIWIGVLIILRDFMILLAAIIYLSKNKKKILKPNLLGKITTFFQMSAVVLFILNINNTIKTTVVFLALFFTLASWIVYMIKGYNLFFNKRKREPKINLPNKITILRITFIPIFVVFLLSDTQFNKEIIATTIFIILALSDALDGYIARKRRQITNFGKLIDPLADKLLVSAALIFLIGRGIEPWMA